MRRFSYSHIWFLFYLLLYSLLLLPVLLIFGGLPLGLGVLLIFGGAGLIRDANRSGPSRDDINQF